jgi:hypothetical protein
MRSANMIVVGFVGADGISGMIEASTTRKASMPRTLPQASTTAVGSPSGPHGHRRGGMQIGADIGDDVGAQCLVVIIHGIAWCHLVINQIREGRGTTDAAREPNGFHHTIEITWIVEEIEVEVWSNPGIAAGQAEAAD